MSKNPPFRLPKTIRPKEYHLAINPDLVQQTFSGTVTITVDIAEKTNKIYLHSKMLNIGTVFLRSQKTAFIPKITYQEKDDIVIFETAKKIEGTWEISIAFTGIIHEDLRGFYISKYDYKGTEELIGTTQFEAIDARRAFPCFDEPDMKAVFRLRITTSTEYTAISNMQVVETVKKVDKKTEYVFAPSPVMSTYLLAWAIGKFEKVTTAAQNGTVINVYTGLGKKHLSNFALSTASKVLDFFEDYFSIPYPLEKLDLIALPDFASGAMENWGLITFRETCLLVDKKNTAFRNMQFIAMVVAHEIAHQWFGNLVTMAWWDDLWLNEGFANYIEYAAVDAIFPEWKIWEDFTQGDMGDALRLDGLKSSHPVEVPITDAHQINEVFDAITYRKGASVIRMLAEYIGEKKFRTGISQYLKANAYKNATTKNLWYHLEKVSKKPVERVMGIWTKQAGFPVLTYTEKKNKITCTQCRYYRNRQVMKKEAGGELWPIPLDDGKKAYLLPAKKTSSLEVRKNAVTLNDKESNLVHIDYTPQYIERQKAALKDKSLTTIQRMGLIRNMRALCESGLAKTTEVLEFLKLFKGETEYIVLSELWGSMVRIDHIFGGDIVTKNALRSVYLEIFETLWQRFNWEAKQSNHKMRSTVILGAAYTLGYEPLTEEALKKFRLSGYAIPAHLRGGVYRIVVRYGSKEDNVKLWKLLETETLHEEKMRIMASFSAVLKTRDIIDVLEYYAGSKVRDQDTPSLIGRLLNETNHPEIVYNYIEHHWGEFVDKFKEGHLLAHLLESLAVIRDESTLKHMKEFFKKYPAPGTQMTLAQVYEKIEGSLAWRKADEKELKKYLSI